MSDNREARYTIAAETPDQLDVLALLQRHLDEMHASSPACKVHALPAASLAQDNVTFFSARADGELAAIGALRRIDGDRCELKSMRAADAWRGKGAGKAMLAHLLAAAKEQGCNWVGLETGKHPVFEPAQRLYAAHGFVECPPFGDYVSDDFSMCMELPLK